MAFWLLMGGAALSLVGGLFHGVAGHKIYMGNINGSNLEQIAKTLSLVSWHMFTILLIVGAGTWFASPMNPPWRSWPTRLFWSMPAGPSCLLVWGC